MSTKVYEIKSGRFAGMWHARLYQEGVFFHVGRYYTRTGAELAAEHALTKIIERDLTTVH